MLGFVDRSGQVSIDALTIGDAADGYRLVIAVHNSSEVEELLKSLVIRATTQRLVLAGCSGLEDSPVEVQDRLTITAIKRDRFELTGSATTGSGGASVRIHGLIFSSCKTGVSWLELSIPTTIPLAPKAYTLVHVNLPKVLALSTPPSPQNGAEGSIVDAAVKLPVDAQPDAYFASAVEVVVSASGSRVATYRHDNNHSGPIAGD